MVIYRFNGALFFANINTFIDDIEKNLDDNTKWVIVDAGGVGSIDVTAVDRLMTYIRCLKRKVSDSILQSMNTRLMTSKRAWCRRVC